MSQILVEINENLQAGKAKAVADLVTKALADGVAPKDILEEGMLSAMSIIGDKFKTNEIYVPEVLIAARAMNRGMEILKPKLVEEGVKAKGVGVIGTVKGDLHDIGKNLVKMMMEGKGIEMIDLGVDVSPEQFIAATKEHNATLICLSALLTTTMGEMKNVVDAVKAEGLEGKVKVMIGGAPVTQAYCDQIGADCYTADAASASDAAIAFLSA